MSSSFFEDVFSILMFVGERYVEKGGTGPPSTDYILPLCYDADITYTHPL